MSSLGIRFFRAPVERNFLGKPMNAIVCPKCAYVRKPTDEGPSWQCPSCKVAYNKVDRPTGSSRAASQLPASITEEAPSDSVGRAEVVRTWAILIIVIGILPWSYFCMTSLGPALGIQNLGLKGMVVAIIAVPALLIWIVSWLTSLYE